MPALKTIKDLVEHLEKEGISPADMMLGNGFIYYTEDAVTKMVTGDLSDEKWREYDFENRVYRIWNPKTLKFRVGGSTHRVLDARGIVHCIPAPGHRGCALRWQAREGCDPIAF